jgi:hypothetical protein
MKISRPKKTSNQIDHKRNANSMLDMKSCRGESSDSDHSLVRGRYRCKIAYSKYEPKRTTRRFHVDALQEAQEVPAAIGRRIWKATNRTGNRGGKPGIERLEKFK